MHYFRAANMLLAALVRKSIQAVDIFNVQDLHFVAWVSNHVQNINIIQSPQFPIQRVAAIPHINTQFALSNVGAFIANQPFQATVSRIAWLFIHLNDPTSQTQCIHTLQTLIKHHPVGYHMIIIIMDDTGIDYSQDIQPEIEKVVHFARRHVINACPNHQIAVDFPALLLLEKTDQLDFYTKTFLNQ